MTRGHGGNRLHCLRELSGRPMSFSEHHLEQLIKTAGRISFHFRCLKEVTALVVYNKKSSLQQMARDGLRPRG